MQPMRGIGVRTIDISLHVMKDKNYKHCFLQTFAFSLYTRLKHFPIKPKYTLSIYIQQQSWKVTDCQICVIKTRVHYKKHQFALPPLPIKQKNYNKNDLEFKNFYKSSASDPGNETGPRPSPSILARIMNSLSMFQSFFLHLVAKTTKRITTSFSILERLSFIKTS